MCNDCSISFPSTIDPVQYISELVLFTSHLDPQLKGTAALTIGHFIKAALIHSTGDFDAWIEQIAPYSKTVRLSFCYLGDGECLYGSLRFSS